MKLSNYGMWLFELSVPTAKIVLERPIKDFNFIFTELKPSNISFYDLMYNSETVLSFKAHGDLSIRVTGVYNTFFPNNRDALIVSRGLTIAEMHKAACNHYGFNPDYKKVFADII